MNESLTIEQMEAEIKRLEPVAHAAAEQRRLANVEAQRRKELQRRLETLRQETSRTSTGAARPAAVSKPVPPVIPRLATPSATGRSVVPRPASPRSSGPSVASWPAPPKPSHPPGPARAVVENRAGPGVLAQEQLIAEAQKVVRNCEAVGVQACVGRAVNHVLARQGSTAPGASRCPILEVSDLAGAILLAERRRGIEIDRIEAFRRAKGAGQP